MSSNDQHRYGNGESSSQLNSSEYKSDDSLPIANRDPLYIVVPMTIVYSIILITGVIGNLITCMVIAKHRYMHTATNYYLFSLAVSDLILLVSGLPQEMWSIWSRYPYVFSEIFCQLRGLLAEMSANATVLTITAFTAERYIAICHPFMAQSMSKLSRAIKFIIVIWFVSVLFAIPQALQFSVSSWNGQPEMAQCNIEAIMLLNTSIELSTVSFTLSTLLFFVLPMTFITILYVLIGLRLRRTDKLKRTITVRSSKGEKNVSSPEYRANSSSKVLKMLVAVVVAFFICWAPFHAQRLIAIYGVSRASSGDETDVPFMQELYVISTYISGVLYYMSTTVNPILYHIMSLKFRTAFKETMLRCCSSDSNGLPGSCKRRRRWSRQLHDNDDSSATADNGRQKYRHVPGRTLSSVDMPFDESRCDFTTTIDRRSSTDGPSDCWRRTLKGLIGGGDRNGMYRYDSSRSGSSAGNGGGDGLDKHARVHGGQRPVVAPSNDWTMISNSSLKDVDSDDLRDELVGYAVETTTMPTISVNTDREIV